MPSAFDTEPAGSKRFDFGENWRHFLRGLNETRIELAQQSLKNMLNVDSLSGKTFLDVGSGSGLFSLAARQLGARVRSFDYDPGSVACTRRLRERFFKDDPDWIIEESSVLDRKYLETLGQYDVVYSWGVLHHTGALWQALENVVPLVKPGGQLFIAIYNDQGWISGYWKWVKRQFNTGYVRRLLLILLHWPYLIGLRMLVRTLRNKDRLGRGMSLWYDMLDWLGGHPFEVAAPEMVMRFLGRRGFTSQRLKTCGRHHGCNEYVFVRPDLCKSSL
ncbi:MAG: class I SAM-dependent methyltransferase [Gammaproteobacteria bacterium]